MKRALRVSRVAAISALLGLMAGAFSLGYGWMLWRYLSALVNPYPLWTAFAVSYALGLLYERHRPSGVERIIGVTVVSVGCLISVSVLAPYIRELIVIARNEALTSKEAIEFFGLDFASLMQNALVGYGASLAVSMALVRFTVEPVMRHRLRIVVLKEKAAACPYCGHHSNKDEHGSGY